MPSGMYTWSQTANSNATADSAINMAEGMAPSAVNDGIRAQMAVLAKWRDDTSGAILTGGSSTAYTVTSYSSFDTLAHMSGQVIAFTPHTTCGNTVTLNVDGLGAKALRSSTGTEILAGMLIAGTPYVALYNNSDAAFYLQGFYGNPYNVPLGAGMDYWGSAAPNAAFAIPIGQQISQTTYASLYALFGSNRYGADGGGLFYLPDKRGRVSVGLDAAGRLANVFAANALGAAGGADTQTLTLGQIPTGITSVQNGISVSTTLSVTVPSASVWTTLSGNTSGSDLFPGTHGGAVGFTNPTASGSINVATTSNNTGGAAHPNVQPTIACNYILRVL